METCNEKCRCVICRLRKKFNSKFEIDKSSNKICFLYESKNITERLIDYKDRIDEIYNQQKPRNFLKIEKDFYMIFDELKTFVKSIQKLLDERKVLEKQKFLCFEILLIHYEIEYLLYVKILFDDDKINIKMNDFTKNEEKLRNLLKKKNEVIIEIEKLPVRIPDVN